MRIKLCQKGKAGSFVPAWRYVNYDYKDAICSNTLFTSGSPCPQVWDKRLNRTVTHAGGVPFQVP